MTLASKRAALTTRSVTLTGHTGAHNHFRTVSLVVCRYTGYDSLLGSAAISSQQFLHSFNTVQSSGVVLAPYPTNKWFETWFQYCSGFLIVILSTWRRMVRQWLDIGHDHFCFTTYNFIRSQGPRTCYKIDQCC